MRHVALLLFVLAMSSSLRAADPEEVAPESLRKYWITLADIAHAASNNKVDRATELMAVEANPAFRNPDDRAKFNEGVQKLLGQIGRIRAKFESFDIIAVHQVSSQAFTVYGAGNGERGPMHLDFDVYFYAGRWHIQGMHFTAVWKRERDFAPRAIFFDKPVVLRLDQPEVASAN